MPIDVITGQPGNGKTALMVEDLLAKAGEKDLKKRRPLWAAGIDGLEPGLAEILKDPRQWNAVRPGETCTCHETENSEACDAHVIPNGSLIYVDEAWKWFGHLHDASRQPTPKHVLDLAEHRHRGLDFVWTTQQPNQLYPFVRGLIGNHTHVLRRFGTKLIDTFSWGELCEDVKSSARREASLRKTRAIPSASFGKYRSATDHTIKAKIPLRVIAIPACIVAGGVLIWLAYGMLKPSAMAATVTGKEPNGAAAPSALSETSAPARTQGLSHASMQDYADSLLPLTQEMPWTAPAFGGRSVIAEPEVYCMTSEAGPDADGRWREASHTCITEQGTRYKMDTVKAKRLAAEGPAYNPYRPKPERGEAPERAERGAGVSPAVTAPLGVGQAGADGQQASYGAFRG